MDILFDLLMERGVSDAEIELLKSSLFLLISLPIVTTLTGILRHIVGLKSLSVYAPIILTFAFYQLGYVNQSDTLQNLQGEYDYLRGLQFGLSLYIIVFAVSTGMYAFLKRVRMHYVPKTTLVMIGVIISLMGAIVFGTALFERKGLVYLDIFSLLMIVTLSETFVSSSARKGFRKTAFVGLQTLFTAIIAYSIISIAQVQSAALEYAFLMLLGLIVMNLYIGRYVSLRLTEYWRFRELLLQDPTPINVRHTKKNKEKQKKNSRA